MILMPFLYFPEDKSEYLPAFITLVIFMSLAILATYYMSKRAKKEEKNFEQKYGDAIEKAKEEDKNLRS